MTKNKTNATKHPKYKPFNYSHSIHLLLLVKSTLKKDKTKVSPILIPVDFTPVPV
jgi:hypothetical protein